ncbi:transglycosylase SLT domain-containing protein [Streptomyces sp. NPDC057877]|uniref:transglycosylase SLT domain-containing protein n=1 Tax=Streptomyces sp. NPDC057877 TaxID=3346269 RepID=UPI0036C9026F
MKPKNISVRGRSLALTTRNKIAVGGVAVVGAAAVALSAVPSNAGTTTTTEAAAPAPVVFGTEQVKDVRTSVTDQLASASLKVEAIEARQQAAAEAAAKATAAKKAAVEAAAKKKAAAEAAAKKKAELARQAKEAASRAAERAGVKKATVKKYANNLDGWIRESLDIMKSKDIPGTYHGLHRNILRESSGNPKAINDWDINAINGVPSKGLLQVIPPTFQAYHVPGTSWNIYDPVANITAAANYAADRYGSIDNVFGAY